MKVKVDEIVKIETAFGLAEVISFSGLEDGKEHVIFAFGDWRSAPVPKVRLHSECLTGDVFGSKRCDCGPQLKEAMQTFSASSGLIVYLRQEGRGIGLNNKLKAYRLQDAGHDTYEANRLLGFAEDLRDFHVAAEMLKALNIPRVCLLSNNPRKAEHLQKHGVMVTHRMFTRTHLCAHNRRYLTAKATYGGHDGLSTLVMSEGVGK
jgi:GTP cyclohydrolase II